MNRNRSGRRYDREFKNNTVALVGGGRTITEVARDLGVSKWSLGHWVRQAEEGQLLSEPKTLTLERPEQRELRRLRQELEYVSRQRDILSLNRSTCFLSVTPANRCLRICTFEACSKSFISVSILVSPAPSLESGFAAGSPSSL